MKGVTDFYGRDRLSFVLWNSAGNSASEAAAADDCIERYGMHAFQRVRSEPDEFSRLATAGLGHFGYGYMLIDARGVLRGVNLHSDELSALLAECLSDGAQATDESGDGFAIKTGLKDKQGGPSGLFDMSNRLSTDLTATLTVELSLPEGWHVYGSDAANPEPTRLEIVHDGGLEFGAPVFVGGSGSGLQKLFGPVKIELPVTAKAGKPLGYYFVHGKLRFMACDAAQCLPPMELPWHATIDAL